MSIQAVGWALEQELPARPKLVLVAIANHADHRTGFCWLKADTIADEASCSPRAVFNFVGDLIRNGFIRRSRKKGDDGKQRANDYWILFDRAAAEWNGDRPKPVAEDADDDGVDADAPDADSTIGSDRDAPGACGKTDTAEAADPVDKPAGAVGPHAPAFTRKSLDEPSESNPKKNEGEHSFASAPRKYQPPPVAPELPQGALHPDASKPIFVYFGTRAWIAWVDYKKRTTGIDWDLKTTITIDGERRTGWHFPRLFPLESDETKRSTDEETATGPPAKNTA